jgi:hypothetical protein
MSVGAVPLPGVGGGGGVSGISDVPGLQAALDAKQPIATAATDPELQSAIDDWNATLAAHAAGAATDAELTAAQDALSALLAAHVADPTDAHDG